MPTSCPASTGRASLPGTNGRNITALGHEGRGTPKRQRTVARTVPRVRPWRPLSVLLSSFDAMMRTAPSPATAGNSQLRAGVRAVVTLLANLAAAIEEMDNEQCL